MNKFSPRKRFGQHFLKDENVLERIVNAFNPSEDDLIIEVGPGTGALTDRLLERVDHLTVVELDRDLAAKLVKKYSSSRIRVIQEDILSFKIDSFVKEYGQDRESTKKVRLVGNLPYNISTPLLFHLLESVDQVSDMVFMLQKEVAQRLSAIPGNKTYGRLTVMAALELECTSLFDVSPQAFDPPPKVVSTVVRLVPRPASLQITDRVRLKEVVRLAFSQRRKTLRNSLRLMVSEAQFDIAGIDSSQRAENLSVDQFIQLSNA